VEPDLPTALLNALPVEQLPDFVVLVDTSAFLKLAEELHVLAFATCVIEPVGIMASIAPTAITVTRRKLNFRITSSCIMAV